MNHGPAAKLGVDKAQKFKTKLGFILFIVYLLIYFGFVVINTVKPILMESILFWGLNLAVVYGIGLIVTAILMGVVYNYFCTKMEHKLNIPDEGGKK